MNTLADLKHRVWQANWVVEALELCCRKGPRSKAGRSARKHLREITAEYRHAVARQGVGT